MNDDTKAYSSLSMLSEASGADETVPPFWKCSSPAKIVLRAYLDKERPFTEAKWVRTGDVQEWLKDILGGRFWVAGDAVGWEKRIEVVSPDPVSATLSLISGQNAEINPLQAPTIQSFLESWCQNSTVATLSDRERFLKNHMSRPDNILEILLRLVRGERATAFTQTTSQISAPSITGPLLTAMDPMSYHAPQQTHVSLAVVAFVRLAAEFAEKVHGEAQGKKVLEERVGEIIRSLPSHLLYKSLDGMIKEWRAEKKPPPR